MLKRLLSFGRYHRQDMKFLVAFDFDNTVIDDNSDLYVRKLAPDGTIPEEISSLYSDKGWTEYMGAIFAYLHRQGTRQQDYVRCLSEIPLAPGMRQLFDYFSQNRRAFDVVIISDANSVFINSILEGFNMQGLVDEVFTNPAHFDAYGCLRLAYYHEQDWCDLSTVNLCKGHILDSFVEQQESEKGVVYDLVAYVGDGTNDLCPSLRLKRPSDLVFPRVGYSLIKKLEHLEDGQTLVAQTVPWSSGQDILARLQQAHTNFTTSGQ